MSKWLVTARRSRDENKCLGNDIGVKKSRDGVSLFCFSTILCKVEKTRDFSGRGGQQDVVDDELEDGPEAGPHPKHGHHHRSPGPGMVTVNVS